MDSSLTQSNSTINQINPALFEASGAFSGASSTRYDADALIVAQLDTESSPDAAQVDVELSDLYKSLSVSAREILSQLNKILEGKLPNGIEGINPEDVTPEKTADTIVNGIAAIFDGYAKSNPELEPEELLSRFFASARKGVESGYSSAFSTLKDLGAFEFEGVQSGVEKTKSLIEEKLKSLEAVKRREYGLTDGAVSDDIAESTTGAVLQQASGALIKQDRVAASGQGSRPLDIAA